MATRPNQKDPGSGRSLLWGAGAALFMVLCCALPVLIAGGALAGIGGWVRSPWLVGAGALLVLIAVFALPRRRRDSDDGCCPPTRSTDVTEDPIAERHHDR